MIGLIVIVQGDLNISIAVYSATILKQDLNKENHAHTVETRYMLNLNRR